MKTEFGIHSQGKEPGYAIVNCRTCKAIVPAQGENWAEEHKKECPNCDVHRLNEERKRRPDQLFITDKGNVVVDYSLVAAIGSKKELAPSTLVKSLARRDAKKKADYAERVEAFGDHFVPVAATAMGSMSKGTTEFLDTLYASRLRSASLTSRGQLDIDIKRIIHSVSAGALLNAERQHGVRHTHQHARSDDQWVREPTILDGGAPAPNTAATINSTSASASSTNNASTISSGSAATGLGSRRNTESSSRRHSTSSNGPEEAGQRA